MSITLRVDNITKAFGSKILFEELSFEFERGAYSVVGPNGVGKTILLEMLAGVSQPDNGKIYLDGIGNATSLNYKQNLVYIPSKSHFYPSATGAEFLNFVLSVKNGYNTQDKLENLIAGFKLTQYMNTKFSKMSLGTQRKLFLATLAIGINRLIILDEPTNGLDKSSNQVLYDFLFGLKSNSIIICATHDATLLSTLSSNMIELGSSKLSVSNINWQPENEKLL